MALRSSAFAFVLLVACGTAQASFELALIVDDTNDQILRYDPVNQIQLGSFARGQMGQWGNPNGLALDPTNPNLVAALDVDGNVRWFNFSTGIFVRSVATGDINEYGYQNFKVLNNGNLLITADVPGTGKLIRIHNGSTGALVSTLTNYSSSGYTSLDCVQAADGTFYSLERTGSSGSYSFHIFHRNSSGNYLNGLFSYAGGTASDLQAEIEVTNNKVFTLGRTSDSFRAATIVGSTITLDALGYSIWTGNYCSGLSLGHGGRAHFSQYRSSVPTNNYYTYDPAGYYNTYGGDMPYTQSIGGMVLVTAPEPGTLAVLGLGALALIKRRRKF